MLIRFSIAKKGGVEVYSFTLGQTDTIFDPQLASMFMEAFQVVSEEVSYPIQQINFSNLTIYVRTYGDFTLRVLTDQKQNETKLEYFFEKISKEILLLIATKGKKNWSDKSQLSQTLEPIINTILGNDRSSLYEIPTQDIVQFTRIALIGLAKAGKTSIKNKFFENWSDQMLDSIKATVGLDISHKEFEFLRKNFIIMDFGGQLVYRKQHLSKKENWKNLMTVIFVIDLSDPDSFIEAKEYLENVWNLINEMNEKIPNLSLFLHKFDLDKRTSLKKNVVSCLKIFTEFRNKATFYLTTIQDSSSNISMIKTLYFSLPEVILERLFEEEFIDYLENLIISEVLPEFKSQISPFTSQIWNKKLKNQMKKKGITYCNLFQKKWFEYIKGDWKLKQRFLSSKSINIEYKGSFMDIQIPNNIHKDIPKDITVLLVDGFLEGICSAFDLSNPQIIEDEEKYATWRIGFTKCNLFDNI